MRMIRTLNFENCERSCTRTVLNETDVNPECLTWGIVSVYVREQSTKPSTRKRVLLFMIYYSDLRSNHWVRTSPVRPGVPYGVR